jgi:hypothetical protein
MLREFAEYGECSAFTFREQQHRKGEPFETRELSRAVYLQRLSPNERHALGIFFDNLHYFRRYGMGAGFTAFAIGTTTYENEYWEGLEKYLAKHDPRKLHFAKRRGQDIDVKLCTESPYEYRDPKLWVKSMTEDLQKLGVPFRFEEEKSNGGTSYLNSPYEYREGKVMRKKLPDYASPKFIVKFPVCRALHVCFEKSLSAETKLAEERINGHSFSILFRSCDIGGLFEAIDQADSSPSLFNGKMNNFQRANSPKLRMQFQESLSAMRFYKGKVFDYNRLPQEEKDRRERARFLGTLEENAF